MAWGWTGNMPLPEENTFKYCHLLWSAMLVQVSQHQMNNTDLTTAEGSEKPQISQISNIIRTLVGNKIVDHSDVVGATSSFST